MGIQTWKAFPVSLSSSRRKSWLPEEDPHIDRHQLQWMGRKMYGQRTHRAPISCTRSVCVQVCSHLKTVAFLGPCSSHLMQEPPHPCWLPAFLHLFSWFDLGSCLPLFRFRDWLHPRPDPVKQFEFLGLFTVLSPTQKLQLSHLQCEEGRALLVWSWWKFPDTCRVAVTQ